MNKFTKTDKKIIAFSLAAIVFGSLLLGYGGNVHVLLAILGLAMIIIAFIVLSWASPW